MAERFSKVIGVGRNQSSTCNSEIPQLAVCSSKDHWDQSSWWSPSSLVKNVFQEIGDWGGWVATEEETVKKHLKCTRIWFLMMVEMYQENGNSQRRDYLLYPSMIRAYYEIPKETTWLFCGLLYKKGVPWVVMYKDPLILGIWRTASMWGLLVYQKTLLKVEAGGHMTSTWDFLSELRWALQKIPSLRSLLKISLGLI